jgi:hypothetical protein
MAAGREDRVIPAKAENDVIIIYEARKRRAQQANRQAGRQTDRQTDRQTGRQRNRVGRLTGGAERDETRRDETRRDETRGEGIEGGNGSSHRESGDKVRRRGAKSR